MKKLIVILMLAALSVAGMATTTKKGAIPVGFTTLSKTMAFTAADSLSGNGGFHIVTGDSLVILISNPQKFLQYQTFTSTLAINSGSGTITIKAYGKVTSADNWHPIGSAVTWTTTGNNPGVISGTTAKNYNYFRVSYVQSGGTECARITAFDMKTANVFPYAGLEISGAAVNINVSSNYAVNLATGTSTGAVTIGGAGAQTIAIGNGAAAKTVALGSSNTTSTTTIKSGSNGVLINKDNNQPTNINTGTSTGLVTIGGGSGTAAINTSVWGITAAGVTSGLTNVTATGTVMATSFIRKTTPAPFDSTGTVTAAKMLRGTIKCVSTSAVTMTTPTATAIAALIPGCGQGTWIELAIDNSGSSSSGAVTVALDGSITQPGSEIITGQKTLTLAVGTVGKFSIYFTSGTAAKIYRIF